MIDTITHVIGSPWMVPALALAIAALYWLAGIDAANFCISVGTLLLLPILLGAQNRDSAAVEAKLDALIKGVPEADNRYIGLDRKTEREIEREREG